MTALQANVPGGLVAPLRLDPEFLAQMQAMQNQQETPAATVTPEAQDPNAMAPFPPMPVTPEAPKEFETRFSDMADPELRINNSDGTYSTHKMMSAEVNGKQIALPTIVNENGVLRELSPKDALSYALKTGEYKVFPNAKEAQAYAEGGYKQGHMPGPALSPEQVASQAPGKVVQLGEKQAGLEREQAKADEPFLKYQADILNQHAQRELDHQQQQFEIDKQVANETRAQVADYKKMQTDYANAHIDPNRLMQGGRGILAAIGVALGGGGAAMAGQPNYALQTLNNAIERDVDAQEKEIGRKKDLLASQSDLITMTRQKYADAGMRRQAMIGLQESAVAAKLKAIAANMVPGQQRTKAEQTAMGMELKSQETGAKLAQDHAQTLYQQKTLDIQRERLRIDRDANQIAKQQKRDMEMENRLVPDWGYAKNADSAKKALVVRQFKNDIVRTCDNALALLDNGGTIPFSDARAEGQLLQHEAIGKLSTMSHTGTVNAGEYPRYSSTLGNPGGYDPTGATRKAWVKLREHAIATADDAMVGFGLPSQLPMTKDKFKSAGPPIVTPRIK